MHSHTHSPTRNDAASVLLREAKRLHQAATSDSLATALPVLRRILATGTLAGLSLPTLHRRRDMVQRKHILRTLAIEAGFNSWEAYRPALALMTVEQLPHFDIARPQAGYPNFWFSTRAEAEAHVALHGGRLLPVGQQAVVLPTAAEA